MEYLQKKSYKYQEEINIAILRQLPKNTGKKEFVLDVGSGMGALSAAIQNKGYSVWAIEINQAAAEVAVQRITKVINADLTDIKHIQSEIGNQKFEFLIFADILEHLYDPLSVLKEYLKLLKDEGYLLVSLPNIVVWWNRILFLLGRFEYTETGIMDKGHIRFFSFKTAKKLVEEAGCCVVRTDYVPFFVRVFEPLVKKFLLKGITPESSNKRDLIDSPYYKWYIKYVYPIEYYLGFFCKPLFAFKMVLVARKLKQT